MRFIRPVSVNNCRIRTLYWHIPSWSGNYALGILVTFIISRTLYYGFLTSIHKVRIHRCWIAAAAFIFQVKILISKSLKSIADDRNNRSITSINNTNLPYQCVHRSPNLFPLSQFSLMKISFDKWISRLLIFRTICDPSPFLFDRLGNSRNNSRLARHLYSFDVQFISKYSVWNNRRFLCKKKLQNKMSRNEIKIFLFKSDCLLMVSWLFLDL